MSAGFIRLASAGVALQAHVSEDSHFVLLPLLERTTQIKGWVVYDAVTGEVLVPDDGQHEDGVFPVIAQARAWVQSQNASRPPAVAHIRPQKSKEGAKSA